MDPHVVQSLKISGIDVNLGAASPDLRNFLTKLAEILDSNPQGADFLKNIEERAKELGYLVIGLKILTFKSTGLPESQGPGNDLIRVAIACRKLFKKSLPDFRISTSVSKLINSSPGFEDELFKVLGRSENYINSFIAFMDLIKLGSDKYDQCISDLQSGLLNKVLINGNSSLAKVRQNSETIHLGHRSLKLVSEAEAILILVVDHLKRVANNNPSTARQLRDSWFRCFPELRNRALTPEEQAAVEAQEVLDKASKKTKMTNDAIRIEKERKKRIQTAAEKRETVLTRSKAATENALKETQKLRKQLRENLAKSRAERTSSATPIELGSELVETQKQLKDFVNSELNYPPNKFRLERVQNLFFEAFDEVRELEELTADIHAFHIGQPAFSLQDLLVYVEGVKSSCDVLYENKDKRANGLVDAILVCEAVRLIPLFDGRNRDHREIANLILGDENIKIAKSYLFGSILYPKKVSPRTSERIPNGLIQNLLKPENSQLCQALAELPLGSLFMSACKDWDGLRASGKLLSKSTEFFSNLNTDQRTAMIGLFGIVNGLSEIRDNLLKNSGILQN